MHITDKGDFIHVVYDEMFPHRVADSDAADKRSLSEHNDAVRRIRASCKEPYAAFLRRYLSELTTSYRQFMIIFCNYYHDDRAVIDNDNFDISFALNDLTKRTMLVPDDCGYFISPMIVSINADGLVNGGLMKWLARNENPDMHGISHTEAFLFNMNDIDMIYFGMAGIGRYIAV